MFIRQVKLLSLALAASALLLLPLSAGAAPNAVGASTPEEAVSIIVAPFYTPGQNDAACNALTGKLDGCPLRPRLLDRLQHPIVGVETGNLISRSQNPPQTVRVSLIDNDGSMAHVDTRWDFGAGYYSITFVVIKEAGAWNIDDSYCTGHPQTSIYQSPTGPCDIVTVPSSGGTGSVPGLPNTGGATGPSGLAFLLMISIMAMLSGAGALLFSISRRNTDKTR